MILLMKKIIIMLTALLTISLSACSQNKKTLVAYFSASGTTKGIAQQLAKVAEADLHEIKPPILMPTWTGATNSLALPWRWTTSFLAQPSQTSCRTCRTTTWCM